MTPIDFTSELAPLIWTMEGLMLIAVAWLVGMFFTEQMRGHDLRNSALELSTPESTASFACDDHQAGNEDRRIAA